MQEFEIKDQIFANELVAERSKLLVSEAKDCIAEQYLWCYEKGLPFIITSSVSTLEEDKKLNRISDTHYQRRAWDISIKQWSKEEVKEFCDHFNFVFAEIAAVDKKGKPSFAVHHNNGNGDHIHCQLHRRFAFITN